MDGARSDRFNPRIVTGRACPLILSHSLIVSVALPNGPPVVTMGSMLTKVVSLENDMAIIQTLIDIVLHLDVHLGQIISSYGAVTYAVLFIVIFVETGLVFVPFLPGDSLLFAAGAFAAIGSLNVFPLLVLLTAAAVIGDTVNYSVGRFAGERIVSNPRMPIKKSHLEKTNGFFKKHGGKTIILARFVPIIRTFAPFVAGAGKMDYARFISYNVIGGVLWVVVGTLAGYFFGGIPFVKDNFSVVVIGVVVISLLPIAVEVWRGRRRGQTKKQTRSSKVADIEYDE